MKINHNQLIFNTKVLTGNFIKWWGQQLKTIIPPNLVKWLTGEKYDYLINVEGEHHSLQLLKNGKWKELVSSESYKNGIVNLDTAPESSRLFIKIPKSKTLQQSIPFPLNASNNIKQILSYEMDRYTPFPANDVYFHYEIKPSNNQPDLIDVNLTLSKKSYLDTLIDKYSTLGIYNLFITSQDIYTSPELITELKPLFSRQKYISKLNTARLGLLGTALILLMLNMSYITYKKELQKNALINNISSLKSDALKASKIQAMINLIETRNKYPAKLLNKYQSKLRILNELSKIIPDNTWLQSLEYNHPILIINGESGSPGSVLTSLTSASNFKNVKFNSPISISNNSNKQHFSIKLELSNTDGIY